MVLAVDDNAHHVAHSHDGLVAVLAKVFDRSEDPCVGSLDSRVGDIRLLHAPPDSLLEHSLINGNSLHGHKVKRDGWGAIMTLCLTQECETYPGGCMTLLPSVLGNWRSRARNVDKAFVDATGDHKFARDDLPSVA